VFGAGSGGPAGLLLPDDVLDEFALGAVPGGERRANSHLSLLAMVDCWNQVSRPSPKRRARFVASR
jgi:prephenate dehydrogenase (NADP+)